LRCCSPGLIGRPGRLLLRAQMRRRSSNTIKLFSPATALVIKRASFGLQATETYVDMRWVRCRMIKAEGIVQSRTEGRLGGKNPKTISARPYIMAAQSPKGARCHLLLLLPRSPGALLRSFPHSFCSCHHRGVCEWTRTKVIEELIGLAKSIKPAIEKGHETGLSEEEVAFYQALSDNESAREVLKDETLRKIARELAESI
jgi:hypothetical protein